jgi:hypothetical protein
MKFAISFFQRSFLDLMLTKLAPTCAFFGSFHYWTVTITPHWFVNFITCFFWLQRFAICSDYNDAQPLIGIQHLARALFIRRFAWSGGLKKKESLIHICIFPYTKRLNIYIPRYRCLFAISVSHRCFFALCQTFLSPFRYWKGSEITKRILLHLIGHLLWHLLQHLLRHLHAHMVFHRVLCPPAILQVVAPFHRPCHSWRQVKQVSEHLYAKQYFR